MPKLKAVFIEGEKFFVSLSFDIDDFIGDGVWWLQIYDDNQEIIYDKPFASSRDKLALHRIKEVIRNEYLTSRGALL
jgi:hypothetical protein